MQKITEGASPGEIKMGEGDAWLPRAEGFCFRVWGGGVWRGEGRKEPRDHSECRRCFSDLLPHELQFGRLHTSVKQRPEILARKKKTEHVKQLNPPPPKKNSKEYSLKASRKIRES